MVECRDLSVKYKDHFGIKNLNISLDRGRTCAIIGKSGCGKTTLLHAIAGLLPAMEGQVLIDQVLVSDIRKDTAVILQDDGLFPWKTVYNNVALGLRVQGMDQKLMDQKVSLILNELNIMDQKDKYPANLSGGQRKRAAIARALALEPDLLLMDEPTSALDMITKEAFQAQMLKLYREHKMTMVVVTHDIEEAAYLGQRIVIMKDGQITADIENPLFMKKDIRNQLEFYELCLEIRREFSL